MKGAVSKTSGILAHVMPCLVQVVHPLYDVINMGHIELEPSVQEAFYQIKIFVMFLGLLSTLFHD